MKKFILIAFLSGFLCADALRIRDFEADVYSKVSQNNTKKVRLNLELIGNDLSENEPYVLDSLNVIIGSFYAEDLLTSLGKEKFKEAFIKYSAKKHALTIDNVLIIGLKLVEKVEIDEIISAIKAKDLCQSSNIGSKNISKNLNDIVISPNLKDINKPIDLNSIGEFKDFGE